MTPRGEPEMQNGRQCVCQLFIVDYEVSNTSLAVTPKLEARVEQRARTGAREKARRKKVDAARERHFKNK
jgi:hypothetical protein